MPFLALVPLAIWISLALTIATTALQYGLAAMQKKPKPATFTFGDDTQSVYDPLAPWRVLYGEGRTGGAVIYKRTNVARNNMWMVVAIGPGPLTAIGDLWMGDQPVFVTGAADGNVQGPYATKLFCWVHLGTANDTVDTNLQTAFPDDWDSNHRLRGIAYVILKLVSDATLYAHGIPNPSFSYRGLAHEDTRTGLTAYTDNPVMVIRSWLMNTVWGRRLPASRIDTANCNDEADFCDEYVTTPQRSDYATVWQAQTFTAVAGTDIMTYVDGWSGADREHGLRYNDPVQFVAGGGLPAGLSAGVTYFARPLTRLTFQVATSKTATTVVDVTTNGTPPNNVVLQGYRMTLGGNYAAATTVDAAADTITMRENATNFYPRWMKTGSRFQITLGTGGVIPPGLAVATDYYAIIVDDHTIKAAAVPGNAYAGIPINIGGAGTQPVQITAKVHNAQATLTLGQSLITFAGDAGFRTGDVISFDPSTPPGSAERTYFWRTISTTSGTLHSTRLDAQRGTNPIIIPGGAGTYVLGSDHALQDDIQFMPTGTIITIDSTPTGTIGGGVSLVTEYYVINRGRGFADGHVTGVIDLAATLSDALNDIPLTVTSGITTQTIHQITRTKERRFTLNGSFDTDTTYGEVLQAMLSSIMGTADPSGGKWRILPARYRPPEITLDADDVHGGLVELLTLLPANKAANTITGAYTTPRNLDQPTNFPTLIDDDAVEEDGGQTIQDEIVLPFTNSEPMAIRLAQIELNRRRRQKTITFPTDLCGGWNIAVGDSFIVDLPGIGQNGLPQVYECTRWALNAAPTSGQGGAPLPLISITGRENDSFVYRQTAV